MKKLYFSLLFLFMSYSLVFSQTIDITGPGNKDIYKAGASMNVVWTAMGITGNIKISLAPAGGGNVITLVQDASPSSSPIQVDIPQNVAPDTYRVRIAEQLNPSIFSYPQNFFINAHNSGLNISLPNRYSRFTWGMQERIKWVRIGIANELKCSLALLKGNSFKGYVAERVDGTSYVWTVPSLIAGTDYRIKVYLDPGGISRRPPA